MTTTDPNVTQTNGASTAPVDIRPSSAIVPASAERAISAFSSEDAFAVAQRMAKALSSSTLVPKSYQNNIPNCLIAMELASRIGASVLMVMQSLAVIHGKPSWESKFLIATVNSSGKFTPLRFKFSGQEGTDAWSCIAVSKDNKTGEVLEGADISIKMAKDEGWYGKEGSKWKTMPKQMLMYRAASFWVRIYAPELSLGMSTKEETVDVEGYAIAGSAGRGSVAADVKNLEDVLLGKDVPTAPGTDPNMSEAIEGEPVPPPVAKKRAREAGED